LVVDSNNLTFANGVANFEANTFIANVTGMTGAQVATVVAGSVTGERYDFTLINGTYTWDAEVGAGPLGRLSGSGIQSSGVTTVNGTDGADTIDLADLTKGYTVTPGAGNDTVWLSQGKDSVDLGGASGGNDIVRLTSATTVSKTGATWGVTNADVITGYSAGDILQFAGFTASGITTTAASVTGTTVGYIKGFYSASTGTFAESVSGTDTLVVFDKNGVGNDELGGVVIVGSALTTGATGVTGVTGG
jgi:hypothetical protein